MDSICHSGNSLRTLERDVKSLLKQGMAKGFFELRVIGEVAKGGQRRIRVLFSPSEQYTVSEEELSE